MIHAATDRQIKHEAGHSEKDVGLSIGFSNIKGRNRNLTILEQAACQLSKFGSEEATT
jgi:hypothetical protein